MAKHSTPKRKYTAEFKADVLRLVANGEPILAVARKMGISDSIIHAWRAAEKRTKGEKNNHPLWKMKWSRSNDNSVKPKWSERF
ncbi:transposase [Spirosoma aerolatum]|uniref:transposase n=1 Tax=Spirosoma aerolatum TaxID=1211326 RepID=UPI0009AEA0A9|nr:transposase [Spirosoma aerolatum]